MTNEQLIQKLEDIRALLKPHGNYMLSHKKDSDAINEARARLDLIVVEVKAIKEGQAS